MRIILFFQWLESIKKRQVIKLRINSETGFRKIDGSLTNKSSYYDKLKNEFIHIIDPKPRLFIVGAVHIAQELVKLATIADFEIILI